MFLLKGCLSYCSILYILKSRIVFVQDIKVYEVWWWSSINS